MRNATSFLVFGASCLVLSLGACGGGDDGSRSDSMAGSGSTSAGASSTAGTGPGSAGSGSGTAGSASGTAGSGGSGGGAAACNPTPGTKKGDGMNKVIDELDDANTMFAPAGTTAMGSWDFGKDAAKGGTITPASTMALASVDGGQTGKAFHVTGTGLDGWGASLAAFLNGVMGSFDASEYGGIAFYIKGTSKVAEGDNKVMVFARMPDVLPGAGSCCSTEAGKECYSAHRVVVDLSAEWKEVKIAWTDFAKPGWGLGSTIELAPSRIRDINFSFNHDAMTMMPAGGAEFDVWIDGLRFLAKDEMGNLTPSSSGGGGGGGGSAGGSGGSGGTGGTGGGGTGGAP